jgi:two-component system chemotaxis response regulator CheY
MVGNVIIVDDSLVARLALKGILKDTGLSLSEANSGESALTLLAQGARPVLLFLDLTMPGMGGIETLRAITTSNPALPVVVVTADIQARTVDMVKELGAAAVVRKPADKAEILAAVERILGKNGA